MDQNIATDIQKYDLLSGKVNITECCRVCMAQSTNMSNIFDDESNLISKIEFCTGFKLLKHDALPSQICDVCMSDLTVAHKFKTACVLSDEALQKYVLNNVKVEIEVEVDFDYDCSNGASVDDTKDTLEPKKEVAVKKEETKSKTRIKKSVRKKKDPSQPLKKRKPALYCEVCQVMLETRKAKNEHNETVHNGERPYICEVCGRIFKNRSTMICHTRTHFPPQFACDTCDYVTFRKHSLVKHIRIHTGIKLYKCEYCTDTFHTTSSLSRHIQICHLKIKKYACTICEMRFYDKTHLNRHLDTHNDVKRFECEVCHSWFTRRCYWKKHLQTQHNITIPRQRPGRQKVNITIGEDKISDVQ